MVDIVFWIVLFLATVILHEVCHGFAACRLGDPTARDAGRLTFNPLKHVDLYWTVLFPAMLFIATQGRFAIGMAKPVPVNFLRLRNPRRDMVIVALAGPLANFILAGALNFFWKLFQNDYFLYGIYFNLGIALFNLVPIPPLDGSRVLAGILPVSLSRAYLKIEPFGFLIVLGLYMSGALLYIIIPGMNFFCRLLEVPTLLEFLYRAQSAA